MFFLTKYALAWTSMVSLSVATIVALQQSTPPERCMS